MKSCMICATKGVSKGFSGAFQLGFEGREGVGQMKVGGGVFPHESTVHSRN